MKTTVRSAALALVLACCATLASAQPKPALVQDRDEPGRNPYQQTLQMKQNSTNCGPLVSLCSFTFDTVPAGKRLVVTNVSVILHTDPATGEPLAYAGPAQIPNFAHWLPAAAVGGRHAAHHRGRRALLRRGGHVSLRDHHGFALTDGPTASASISGYYVSVP